jgi:hypothetical protein
MAVMTMPAVLALAASCQSIVAPTTIAKIAMHESALDPAAIHRNVDGSIDVGLMQINSKNWAWLGITGYADAMDPCRSIAAGAAVLTAFSRYNTGSSTRGIANGYAVAVQSVRVSDQGIKASPAPHVIDPPPSVFARPGLGRALVFASSPQR